MLVLWLALACAAGALLATFWHIHHLPRTLARMTPAERAALVVRMRRAGKPPGP